MLKKKWKNKKKLLKINCNKMKKFQMKIWPKKIQLVKKKLLKKILLLKMKLFKIMLKNHNNLKLMIFQKNYQNKDI